MQTILRFIAVSVLCSTALVAQVTVTHADPTSINGMSTTTILDSNGAPISPLPTNPLGPSSITVIKVDNTNENAVNLRIICCPDGNVIGSIGLPGETLWCAPGGSATFTCPNEDDQLKVQYEVSSGVWVDVMI